MPTFKTIDNNVVEKWFTNNGSGNFSLIIVLNEQGNIDIYDRPSKPFKRKDTGDRTPPDPGKPSGEFSVVNNLRTMRRNPDCVEINGKEYCG